MALGIGNWGGNMGARARAGGQNFLVGQMSTLFTCSVHPKNGAGHRGKDWMVRGPEAETLGTPGSFWTCNGSCKFACFLIFVNDKNHMYLCCLAKIMFNKSRSMCIVTRRHHQNFSWEGQPWWLRYKGKGNGAAISCSPPFSFWHHPCSQ